MPANLISSVYLQTSNINLLCYRNTQKNKRKNIHYCTALNKWKPIWKIRWQVLWKNSPQLTSLHWKDERICHIYSSPHTNDINTQINRQISKHTQHAQLATKLLRIGAHFRREQRQGNTYWISWSLGPQDGMNAWQTQRMGHQTNGTGSCARPPLSLSLRALCHEWAVSGCQAEFQWGRKEVVMMMGKEEEEWWGNWNWQGKYATQYMAA